MSRIYDNWERLVGATMKREQLRQLALADSISFSSMRSDLTYDLLDCFELEAILSSDQWNANDLVAIEGAPEALLRLIRGPTVSLKVQKASFFAIFDLVASSARFSNQKAGAHFAEIGIVPVLLEMMVDSERSICEKALGVLDGICSCNEGMEKACENALTAPLLVKKIGSVSDLASGFAVSILLKLGRYENKGRGAILEALEVGLFNRLIELVELKVGSSETTKKNATELLNLCRKFSKNEAHSLLHLPNTYHQNSGFLDHSSRTSFRKRKIVEREKISS